MAATSILCPDFVGRKHELTFLLGLFREAEMGEGSLVILEGDAGIGKSRLLAEVTRNLVARNTWLATGHCLEYIRSSYMPFQQILTQIFGIATASLKKSGTLAGSAVWPQIDPRDTSDSTKLMQFQAVLRELQRLARVRPLLLLLEDFQWADVVSAELLQYLGRHVRNMRLLLAVTVRSDPVPDSYALSTVLAKLERHGAHRMKLGRFSSEEIDALLTRAMFAHRIMIDGNTIHRIEALADGNPLYAEELLRSATAKKGSDDASPVALPLSPSLASAIRERLQHFDPLQRSIVQQAAVIGRQFSAEFLEELVERPANVVRESLRLAHALDLIVELDMLPPRYAFRHALVREIIYRELLAVETMQLHERIASTLEAGTTSAPSHGDGDLTAELAYHWAQAGNAEKAIAFNMAAGDAAAATSAYADAVGFYQRAAPFVERSSALGAEVCEKLAYSCYVAGFVEDARRWSDQAIERYGTRDQHEKVAEMLLQLSRLRMLGGAERESYSLAERAVDLLQGHTNLPTYLHARIQHAQNANQLTHWKAALDDLREIEDRVPEMADGLVMRFRDILGMALANLGRVDEAIAQFEEAAALFDRIVAEGSPDALAHLVPWNDYGFVLSWLGRNREACTAYERAASIAEANGYRVLNGFIELGHARALLRSGALAQARDRVELGLERGRMQPRNQLVLAELGIPLGLALGDEELIRQVSDPETLDLALAAAGSERVGAVAAAFVELAAARDDRDEAARLLQRALPRIESAAQSWWLLAQAALYGTRDDADRARALLIVDAALPHHRVSQAFLLLFDAYSSAGNAQDCVKSGHVAGEAFAALGWRVFEAKALEVAGDFESALAIYRDIGAASALRRLEASASRTRRTAKRGAALTGRERDVSKLVAEGRSNRQVAVDLGIRESTVGHHLESIFGKLGVTSRTQLAAALLRGAVDMGNGETNA